VTTPNPDPEENLPDWLKALRRKQSEQDQPEEQAADPAASQEEPDWLAEIRKRHSGESAHDAERALTDTQPNKPLRLEKRQLDMPPDEAGEPIEEPDKALVPDWLDSEEPETEEAATPEELEEASEDTEPLAVTPAFSGGEEEPLSPGELPSWLEAIRPGGGTFPEQDDRSGEMLPEPEAENSGPLAGLSGVLPADPTVARISKAPVFSTRLDVSEAQYRHAAVLRDLIASEGRPQEDLAASTRRPARLLNMLMSGALLLAALAPMLTGSQNAARPELNAFPESADVFNQIDVLPPDAPVLVVFDVQPALYGEMKAPLSAVLDHLIEKQARLVFISTQATGPALAQRLLQEEFAASPLVIAGDYVSLGYLPGGMAAARSFASDPRAAALSAPAAAAQPWTHASLQGINTLSDFALVLVAASEGEDGRVWVEQASPSLPDGMLLVTSAQAAPSLRPYLGTEPVQVGGLVAGVSGATYYERLRARDTTSREYWEPFSYELGAVVLLILLGGLYGRVIQTRPDKPRVKSDVTG
jgi:hypothetical protein